MSTGANSEESLFMRLLCHGMIPAELSEALRLPSYDVAEARLLPAEVQQDDAAILEEATRRGRAVVTGNYSDPGSNFCVIHEEWRARGKEHAGINLAPGSRSAAARAAGTCATAS
jgi:hypothetical protein